MKPVHALVALAVAALALVMILWWRNPLPAPADGGNAPVAQSTADAATAAVPANANASGGGDAAPRTTVPLDPNAPVYTVRGHVLPQANVTVAGAQVVAYPGRIADTGGFMSMMSAASGGKDVGPSPFEPGGTPLARVTVAGDGSFQLATNVADLRLQLEHDFYGLGLPEIVHVPHDTRSADVVLAPYLGACIHGRLLGPDRAQVDSIRLSSKPDPMGVMRDPKGFLGAIARAAQPAEKPRADGTFTCRAAVPNAWITLFATGGDVTGRAALPPLEPGENRECGVQVQRALQFAVRIVDDGGAPVAGAHVSARPDDVSARDAMSREMGAVRGTTDADGRAVLRGVTPGNWLVRAAATGFVPETTPIGAPAERELAVTLHRGAAIRGTVVDPAGAPVAGARVTSSPAMNLPMIGDMSAQLGSDALAEMAKDGLPTDAQGHFELSGLDDDAVRTVIAVHDDFAVGIARSVHVGDADVRIALSPACNCSVRAVDDRDGKPIASFVVELRQTIFAMLERPVRTEQVDAADGKAELRRFAPGDYTLAARAAGYSEATASIVLAPAAEPTVHELRLVPAASVSGRVVDEHGVGIAGALVQRSRGGIRDNPILAMMQDEAGLVRCDDRGQFLLRGLPPGRTQLAANADGFAGGKSERLELQAGQQLGDVVIALDHGGSIAGVVRTVHGESAEEFTLIVQSETTQKTRPCRAAADGSFRVDNLEPGRYQVQAMHPATMRMLDQAGNIEPDRNFDWQGMISRVSEGTVSQRCVVRAGEVAEVELDASDLGTGTRLTLMVTVGGQPLEAGMVEATLVEDGRQHIGVLVDGKATFAALRPGRLRVQVRTGMTMTPVGEPQYVDVPVGVDQHRASIELPGGELSGRVLGDDGLPLPAALVRLVRPRGNDDDLHGTAITDDGGAFTFRALTPGTYGLVAADALMQRSTAGEASRVDGIALGDGEHRGGIELRAQPAVGITVTVTDSNGAPLSGAMLLAVDADGRPFGNFALAVSGRDGRAHLGGLPRGGTRVVGRAPDQAPGVTDLIDARPGQSIETALRLLRGPRVALEAHARDGAPLVGASVQARCNGGPWLPSLLLLENNGAGGRFELGRLGPGDWEFRVEHAATGAFTVRRAIADGPAVTILATPPE